MDVKFIEFPRGRDFTIEVGYFDTVQEIKEKIQKYQGIPTANQTLIFKGQVMVDERDIEFYEVLHGSQIQLQVKHELSKRKESSSSSSSSSTSHLLLQLVVKVPNLKKQFSIEMEATDTVNKLKEKIQDVERLPINRYSVIYNGNELRDDRTLEDYSVSNLSEIVAVLRQPFPSSPSNNGGGGSPSPQSSKRLKLMVLPKGGAQKIQVEVNAADNVGELRKELQKLQQQINFSLPSEGYFFIYKQNVMDDDRSFRWHDVKQGDTIEIFNGSVTGGS